FVDTFEHLHRRGHGRPKLGGFRSRPTWRVMCYSAQEPPLQRGLVLIDAVDARVVECLVEDNPDR
ncbi:MAG: hypothetical protein ACKOEH_00545, partial [Actinomycetota bacterium]